MKKKNSINFDPNEKWSYLMSYIPSEELIRDNDIIDMAEHMSSRMSSKARHVADGMLNGEIDVKDYVEGIDRRKMLYCQSDPINVYGLFPNIIIPGDLSFMDKMGQLTFDILDYMTVCFYKRILPRTEEMANNFIRLACMNIYGRDDDEWRY